MFTWLLLGLDELASDEKDYGSINVHLCELNMADTCFLLCSYVLFHF